MNAINETIVTTTTIRSSMQFLLVGRWILYVQYISTLISAARRLRRQAQERLDRKRLWQVRQGTKFCQPARAPPYRLRDPHPPVFCFHPVWEASPPPNR